jgi:hypothetical protein
MGIWKGEIFVTVLWVCGAGPAKVLLLLPPLHFFPPWVCGSGLAKAVCPSLILPALDNGWYQTWDLLNTKLVF